MNRTLISMTAAALLLTGCAGTAVKPDAAPAAPAAATAADVPQLAPQDRAAFFVHYARSGDLAAVTRELNAGIGVNVHDNIGQTALIAAISQGSAEITALLLKRGANPDEADNAGWTPLHYATYFGSGVELIDLLLKAGAKIDAQNDRGITPLYFATATAHEIQVAYLIAHKADRNIASNNGITPLRLAQTKGFETIALLLDPAAPKPAPPKS